jgi:hypothetical protein
MDVIISVRRCGMGGATWEMTHQNNMEAPRGVFAIQVIDAHQDLVQTQAYPQK